MILVMMEEAQGTVGIHRRDPNQTVLIGVGRRTSSAGPHGLGFKRLLEFSQISREPMKAFEEGSAVLSLHFRRRVLCRVEDGLKRTVSLEAE